MKRVAYLIQMLTLLLSLSSCAHAVRLPGTSPQTTPSTAASHSKPAQTTATLPLSTAPPESEAAGQMQTVPSSAGNRYTDAYLESLDNTLHPYGCGRNYNSQRPQIPITQQQLWSQWDAEFIGPDEPCVYLTFDCGYEYQNLTADILDTLKEKGVKAVFFVTLNYCKAQPAMVQRMLDEGHALGNHSAGHHSMPELRLEEMTGEILILHEYVKENFGYEMTLFRPPKGEFSARSLAVAQNLGYRSVFWSFAYQDWITDAQPNVEDAFRTVSGCAHNGCIYLLHAVSSANAAILPELIDDLQSRGYTCRPYP